MSHAITIREGNPSGSNPSSWASYLTTSYAIIGSVYHVITYRWQEVMMYTGVVCAVINATASFFQKDYYKASSFLLLGVLSGISAFYMRHISILKEMEETQKKSAAQLVELTGQNQTLTKTNEELSGVKDTLAENVSKLTAMKETFEKENVELGLALENLQKKVTDLTQANSALEKEISQFKQQNTILQQTALSITAQVAAFQQGNQQNTEQSEAFAKSLSELLGKITTSIEFGKTLLTEEQQKRATELETIFAKFKQHFDSEALAARFIEHGIVQKNLQKSAGDLSATEATLRAKIEELSSVKEQLAKHQQALGRQIRAFEEQGRIYGAQNQELRDSITRLSPEKLSQPLEEQLRLVVRRLSFPENNSNTDGQLDPS